MNKIENLDKGLNFLEKLISFVKSILKNIYFFFQNHFYRVNLKKLTKYEKQIINKFYNLKLEEYTLESNLKITNDNSPIIAKLIYRKILQSQTTISLIDNYNGFGVNYKLTDKALKKLNNKKFNINS